jgi:hypothetical protein
VLRLKYIEKNTNPINKKNTMKTHQQFSKSSPLLLMLMLSLSLAFTACEKEDDNFSPSSYNNPTDVKTEAFAVQRDQWHAVGNYMEVQLPSLFYNNSCTYLKIYQKISRPDLGTEVWQELPFEYTEFNIRSNRIYVQKHEPINQDLYQFLIEIKCSDKK